MPRYHFSANNDCFVQRAPFINYDAKLQPRHVCRFIGIGKFPTDNEKSKGKYLYAIQTGPLTDLEDEKLNERPDDMTENPYIKLIVRRDDRLENEKSEAKVSDHLQVKNIFSKEHTELSQEYLKQVKEMAENITLHVSGFKE